MTGRKGRDSAAARRSGNVYNRPSYGAVRNAVHRLWESSFYFSMGCEQRFPWRNGRLCTFPLCYLFIFQRSRSSAHSIGQRPIRSVPGERAASSGTELFGGLGASPNKRFCGAKRQSVYHSALLASFLACFEKQYSSTKTISGLLLNRIGMMLFPMPRLTTIFVLPSVYSPASYSGNSP